MLTPYHKIDTLFKRDSRGQILAGEWTQPEFEYLADNPWCWTEKVDGTNIRLGFDGSPTFRGNEHAYIAGRTDNAQISPSLLARLIDLMRAMPFETVFPDDNAIKGVQDVTLYGEGYGARIQKGGGNYIADGVDFVLFDVNVGGWWLRRPDVEQVAADLGITAVPIIGYGTLRDAIAYVKEGFGSHRWENVTQAEGLVVRPTVELRNRGGGRIITKIKHRDFQ